MILKQYGRDICKKRAILLYKFKRKLTVLVIFPLKSKNSQLWWFWKKNLTLPKFISFEDGDVLKAVLEEDDSPFQK